MTISSKIISAECSASGAAVLAALGMQVRRFRQQVTESMLATVRTRWIEAEKVLRQAVSTGSRAALARLMTGEFALQ